MISGDTRALSPREVVAKHKTKANNSPAQQEERELLLSFASSMQSHGEQTELKEIKLIERSSEEFERYTIEM